MPGAVAERVLVNFFYAQPVGHAIEALHYCLGHHVADPERRVSVALNAATAHELAGFCPFIEHTYAIDHPFVEPCADSAARLASVPREWNWVLDDFRRAQDFQVEAFPGMRDYYAASDAHLIAARGRGVVGSWEAGYTPHEQLRLELPAAARTAARDRLGDGEQWIAVMPAGSSERSLYPSVASWATILDALAEAYPTARFVLVGKLARDRRTASTFGADELADLLAHRTRPVDCFDVPLAEQLATVEACDLFLSPHTGFGLAALAVATPWLTISGGRWFEYFFNPRPLPLDHSRCRALWRVHPVRPRCDGGRRRRRAAHADHEPRAHPRRPRRGRGCRGRPARRLAGLRTRPGRVLPGADRRPRRRREPDLVDRWRPLRPPRRLTSLPSR
jgi:hypothetical protein